MEVADFINEKHCAICLCLQSKMTPVEERHAISMVVNHVAHRGLKATAGTSNLRRQNLAIST